MNCDGDDQDWDASDEELYDEQDPSDDLLPCPSCGGLVHEDTQQCPQCGDWIMPLAAASRRRSGLWIAAALLALAGMLAWVLG